MYIRGSEPDATWKDAEPVDWGMNPRGTFRYFGNEKQKFRLHSARIERESYIGFFSFFDTSSEIIFKVKNVKDSGRRKCSGWRVDQADKPKILGVINHITGQNIYTDENVNSISRIALGIILEMLMRYTTVRSTLRPEDASLVFMTGEVAYINRDLLDI